MLEFRSELLEELPSLEPLSPSELLLPPAPAPAPAPVPEPAPLVPVPFLEMQPPLRVVPLLVVPCLVLRRVLCLVRLSVRVLRIRRLSESMQSRVLPIPLPSLVRRARRLVRSRRRRSRPLPSLPRTLPIRRTTRVLELSIPEVHAMWPMRLLKSAELNRTEVSEMLLAPQPDEMCPLSALRVLESLDRPRLTLVPAPLRLIRARPIRLSIRLVREHRLSRRVPVLLSPVRSRLEALVMVSAGRLAKMAVLRVMVMAVWVRRA